MVNSLHWQGVQQLGARLEIEARAPDGLIEAFACATRPALRSPCSGIPSGRPCATRFSRALFGAPSAMRRTRARRVRNNES